MPNGLDTWGYVLGLLLVYWGAAPGEYPTWLDFNDDGRLSGLDFVAFYTEWLRYYYGF
jgi:hypothetical protein